jgi:hypothetical protein
LNSKALEAEYYYFQNQIGRCEPNTRQVDEKEECRRGEDVVSIISSYAAFCVKRSPMFKKAIRTSTSNEGDEMHPAVRVRIYWGKNGEGTRGWKARVRSLKPDPCFAGKKL